jgi:hypothetical protein
MQLTEVPRILAVIQDDLLRKVGDVGEHGGNQIAKYAEHTKQSRCNEFSVTNVTKTGQISHGRLSPL